MEPEWSEVALNGNLHASESNNSSKNINITHYTQNYTLQHYTQKFYEITRSNVHLSKIEIEIEAIQCTFDVF